VMQQEQNRKQEVVSRLRVGEIPGWKTVCVVLWGKMVERRDNVRRKKLWVGWTKRRGRCLD
jgi:hypothetical protein